MSSMPSTGMLLSCSTANHSYDETTYIEVIVNGTTTRLVWAVNNITDIKGKVPLIGAAYDAASKLGWPTNVSGTVLLPPTPPFVWNYTNNVTAEGGPGAKVGSEGNVIIKAKQGDVVEIVLQNARALNGAAEFHPWHIHGHSFWVVGSGNGIYDSSLVNSTAYNLKNPLLRDSVTLWPLQWVALRFVADNPGVWFFHCHITSHLIMGMGFTMIVSPDKIGKPSQSVTSCGDHSLEPDPN
jgi:FtsP/CotA-like multicopper oxidase with cupredoxin domain